jgi:hypothetical protein
MMMPALPRGRDSSLNHPIRCHRWPIRDGRRTGTLPNSRGRYPTTTTTSGPRTGPDLYCAIGQLFPIHNFHASAGRHGKRYRFQRRISCVKTALHRYRGDAMSRARVEWGSLARATGWSSNDQRGRDPAISGTNHATTHSSVPVRGQCVAAERDRVPRVTTPPILITALMAVA